jgi:hypothetical protein
VIEELGRQKGKTMREMDKLAKDRKGFRRRTENPDTGTQQGMEEEEEEKEESDRVQRESPGLVSRQSTKRFLSSPLCPDRVRNLLFLYSGYLGIFPQRYSDPDAKITSYNHLVTRLRMFTGIPPLPHASSRHGV